MSRHLHPNYYFGLLFHGSKIWISELLGIVITFVLLVALMALTLRALRNEIVIHANMRALKKAKTGRISLIHEHNDLREKTRLAEAVRTFLGSRVSPPVLRHLVELVYTNSKRYGYDPLLVLAVINVESYFDPNALGRYRNGKLSGAFGLMQLKPETAREVARQVGITYRGKKDLFKPEVNLPLGVAYLTQLIGRFKSLKLGILAYNQGPGTIRKTLSAKRPLSIRYYNRVLKSYYRLKAIIST